MSSRLSGKFVRYLMVGGSNTALGYGLFSLLNYLLSGRFSYGYLAAAVIGNFVSITVAFFGYKFIVFRTTGGWIREYLRIWIVYGGAMIVNMLLLPVLVELLGMNSYVAQAVLVSVIAVASFLGHKHFTFALSDATLTDQSPR